MSELALSIITSYAVLSVALTTALIGYFAWRGLREHLKEMQ